MRQALLVYASFGVPADSVVSLASRLDTLVSVHMGAAVPADFECHGRRATLALAFPVVPPTARDSSCWGVDVVQVLQWAAGRGDTARVLAIADRVTGAREGIRPGDVAPDRVFLEAFAFLEVGDTLRAVHHLDRLLGALAALRSDLLPDPNHAAGLVRAMAMRARLAGSRGENQIADRWARGVVDLWGQADAELLTVVDEMQEILRQ